MKNYTKSKSGKNQAGPGYRTADFFKKSRFEGKGKKAKYGGFNPSKFKIQHKG